MLAIVFFHKLLIGCFGVIGPLVLAKHFFYDPFREHCFHGSHHDDVVFSVEVYPALVAVVDVFVLNFLRFKGVEDII